MRKMRGFTLIELLVVMVIIGILIAIALPNYVKAKDRARESQVQSNIHVIQMAVERYAVDNDGFYPKWLFGGDYSDWDTIQFVSPVWCPGLSQTTPCGDGDALLEFGFLSAYPKNPFMLSSVSTGRNLQVLDCPNPRYSNGDANGLPAPGFCNYGTGLNGPGRMGTTCQAGAIAPSCRHVGGISNQLMWDVSEGAFGSIGGVEPFYGHTRGVSVMRVRGWAGHPPWPILCNRGAVGCNPDVSATPQRRLAPYLVGNFYYYPITQNMNMVFTTSPREPMVGYNLAGYGAIWNLGHDVYDAMGDYEEGKLFCDADALGDCVVDTNDSAYLTNAGYRRIYCVSNGPDGQRDGVIVVVSSGRDRSVPMDKSKPGCGQ